MRATASCKTTSLTQSTFPLSRQSEQHYHSCLVLIITIITIMNIRNGQKQGRSQTLNLRWARKKHFLIFLLIFLYFLSFFPNFSIWSSGALATPLAKSYIFNVDARRLTLRWPRYFHSRWCPRGSPSKKTTFPQEFCNDICTIHVCTIKNHIPEKNKMFKMFHNGGQITDFYFASFWFWPKFEKPLSQRNFSLKFGSKQENMNRLTLLKYFFWKEYLISKWSQNKFLILHNNANLLISEKTTGSFRFVLLFCFVLFVLFCFVLFCFFFCFLSKKRIQ